MKSATLTAIVALAMLAGPAEAQRHSSNEHLKLRKVHTTADQMPEFRGDLTDYMVKNLKYPESAQKAGKEGRVVVGFVVEADGRVSEVYTAKTADPALDAEALRVVQSMPNWKPGIKDGKPVAVTYMLPVVFALNKQKVHPAIPEDIRHKK